ncbi:MAG: membrane protein insertase YidC [Candidatus Omnitrophica bacterium]|nr:membrane protein insertase YidC [Candidatus Omnitrophota bacterium]
MDKKVVLAIALSFLILMGWSTFISKTQNSENKAVTGNIFQEKTAPKALVKAAVSSEKTTLPPTVINFDQEKFRVSFIETQGAIKEITFNNYQKAEFLLAHGLLYDDDSITFTKLDQTKNGVSFRYQDENKKIIKRFIFHNNNYTIELEIEAENISSVPIKLQIPIALAFLDFSPGNPQAAYQDVAVGLADKIIRPSPRKDLLAPGIKYIGTRNRYFCGVIEPESPGYSLFIKKIDGNTSKLGVISPDIDIQSGQKTLQKFYIYLGPQDLRIINSINPEWSIIIYYGFFDFISNLLFQLLGFIYNLVGNWGWAIIIVSAVVYLILFPLTIKQMQSMRHMQLLAPKIEELKKLYKDNPQRMHKETMELYKKNKVNPAGGCIPMILQIPIFVSFYQVLNRSIVIKGASFFWIKDLSEPDRLFTYPVDINILPILMAIGMLVQQKLSTAKTTGEYAQQQKMMTLLMPVIFGFFFYRMPSGLVLYWLINSTLMLAYQIRVNQSK